MSSSSLRVESIKVKDLYEFACRFIENAEGQEIVPTTKPLALSQSKNPCADPQDIALLVAYVGDKCVGHQGLLPIRVTSPEGTGKAFWCTGLYVLPEYRNQLVAVKFVRELLSLDQDYVLNDFAPSSGQLFAAMHFKTIPPLEYRRLRVDRLDLVGIPFLALIKYLGNWRVLRVIGEMGLKVSRVVFFGIVRAAYYAVLMRRGRNELARYTLTEVDRVRPLKAARTETPGTRFLRDTDAVNWTLEYPWTAEQSEGTKPPYFFPETLDIFRNIAVEILGPQREYHGFVFLSVVKSGQRTELKLRDFQTAPEISNEIVFWIACEYARRHRADSLKLPTSLGPWLEDVPLKSVIVQESQCPYLFHAKKRDSVLATLDENVILSLNDGDTAFL